MSVVEYLITAKNLEAMSIWNPLVVFELTAVTLLIRQSAVQAFNGHIVIICVIINSTTMVSIAGK